MTTNEFLVSVRPDIADLHSWEQTPLTVEQIESIMEKFHKHKLNELDIQLGVEPVEEKKEVIEDRRSFTREPLPPVTNQREVKQEPIPLPPVVKTPIEHSLEKPTDSGKKEEFGP